uniref:LRRcap domain-containing protein n=1 Tax=Caenorhabditis japonica TaxID=281687 RepID=A0A8R1HNE1_CAEJA
MLSMVKCGLTTFADFPTLPALSYLDVSDNDLGDNAMFDIIVRNAPELERLTLAGNKLSIENLRPLKMLMKLSELDLTNNSGLGLVEDYRVKVFEMIPSLKILDGCDVDGNEVEEEFAGEGGEESEGEESDDDGPGLSYLNKSQFSDDETDDYEPTEQDISKRGAKRSAVSDKEAEEPEANPEPASIQKCVLQTIVLSPLQLTMPTMEERFAVEMRDRDPVTVDTILLDNSEGGHIAGINEKLINLTVIFMIYSYLLFSLLLGYIKS